MVVGQVAEEAAAVSYKVDPFLFANSKLQSALLEELEVRVSEIGQQQTQQRWRFVGNLVRHHSCARPRGFSHKICVVLFLRGEEGPCFTETEVLDASILLNML